MVTEVLYTALQYLRDGQSSQVMWIDAICINQADLDERRHQVQLMKHIYSDAVRVLVWLGEEDEDSRLAMSILEKWAEWSNTPENMAEHERDSENMFKRCRSLRTFFLPVMV